MKNTMEYKNLEFGELYISTRSHVYSNYDDNWRKVSIPENEVLLFRSFQPYSSDETQNLALFYWMKHKMTVCLCVSEETPILYLSHIEWDKREGYLNLSQAEA